MKTRRAIVLALLAVIAPATSLAAPIRIGPTAGLAVPFGDFGDVASTGFALGVTGDYALNDRFLVGGEIGWQTFGGSDDFEKGLSATFGTEVDVKVTTMPFLVHGTMMIAPSERLSPYAKLSAGVYRTSFEFESSLGTDDDSSTDVGFGLGGGFLTGADKVKYGLDASLHFISTEGETTNILLVRGQLLFGAGGGSE
jgi:hypothetical protein